LLTQKQYKKKKKVPKWEGYVGRGKGEQAKKAERREKEGGCERNNLKKRGGQ